MALRVLARPSAMAVVLVVNDDRDMLDMYGAVIEEMGHEPLLRVDLQPDPKIVVATGADAVVIDLQGEVDHLAGLRAIEALRADPATRDLPIVLATGARHEVRPLVRRLRHLDVPVLIKPFAIDQLREVLGRLLSRHTDDPAT
jgi:DNA-binding response OmpR family regulator